VFSLEALVSLEWWCILSFFPSVHARSFRFVRLLTSIIQSINQSSNNQSIINHQAINQSPIDHQSITSQPIINQLPLVSRQRYHRSHIQDELTTTAIDWLID